MRKKKIIISVTNDLFSDQRVDRTCSTFYELGYDVLLIGRKRKTSPPIEGRPYSIKRLKLIFNNGFLFYAEYNIRLFFILLSSRFNILYANDLDTLPANFLASKLKTQPLIYDSHEYFTEMPELTNAFAKKFWTFLEARLLPRIKYNITVCDTIATIYKNKYGNKFSVVRNTPKAFTPSEKSTRAKLDLPEDKNIIILQGGGINRDRGVEELIEAMDYLPDVFLLILGGGDQIETLKNLAQDKIQKGQIRFIPRQNYQKMMSYTVLADLGLALEKASNLNMEYSLPNKIFEYIQAQIPILSTALPEKKALIQHYQIGELIKDIRPVVLADKISQMLTNQPKKAFWKEKLKTAAKELVWEKESLKLKRIIQDIEQKENING